MHRAKAWTIGSLCTGYAGVDLGVAAALGDTRTLWCADPDPYVSAVLRRRLPEANNIGDITEVDFATLERPDILTAGFPCQDISSAGQRKGIRKGTRSGIWSYVVEATRTLEPRYLFVENVAALRWRRGGLDRVLGDLAAIGYDAHWLCLRAADVGAPPTAGSGCSFSPTPEQVPLLPTPQARDSDRGGTDPARRRHAGRQVNLTDIVSQWPTLCPSNTGGSCATPASTRARDTPPEQG